jgi:hypothetical protein
LSVVHNFKNGFVHSETFVGLTLDHDFMLAGACSLVKHFVDYYKNQFELAVYVFN